MPEVIVENIVASTSFADKLDLDVIAQSLEEAEYDHEKSIGFTDINYETKKIQLLGVKQPGFEQIGTTLSILSGTPKEPYKLGLGEFIEGLEEIGKEDDEFIRNN